MSETIAEVIGKFDFQAIGEQNPKIKQVRGIISNSKPNPHKLFAAEGIWLLGMCEKFGTPVDSLILCPEHIRTPEAASLAGKIAARASERTPFRQRRSRRSPSATAPTDCSPSRSFQSTILQNSAPQTTPSS